MKALTVRQPWASLIACGAKRIETRSWRTAYRGPLAIHAASRMSRDERDFWDELVARGTYGLSTPCPLGAVVATCRLVRCVPTEEVPTDLLRARYGQWTEADFGDFTPGRWAWMLADVEATIRPLWAVGHLGLWEWP